MPSLLTWNKELLGDPPGSLVLKCPEVLRRCNWYFDEFTLEEDRDVMMWRLQAAYRLRAALKGTPFYAKRAGKCRAETGTEMPYWLELQGSQMTLERCAPLPDSVAGLTAEDLPPSLPLAWLHPVEPLLLSNRPGSMFDARPATLERGQAQGGAGAA